MGALVPEEGDGQHDLIDVELDDGQDDLIDDGQDDHLI